MTFWGKADFDLKVPAAMGPALAFPPDMQTKEEPMQFFISDNIAAKSCQTEPSTVDTKALRSVGVQAAPCTKKGRGSLGPP